LLLEPSRLIVRSTILSIKTPWISGYCTQFFQYPPPKAEGLACLKQRATRSVNSNSQGRTQRISNIQHTIFNIQVRTQRISNIQHRTSKYGQKERPTSAFALRDYGSTSRISLRPTSFSLRSSCLRLDKTPDRPFNTP
jgi:hypothetical protein